MSCRKSAKAKTRTTAPCDRPLARIENRVAFPGEACGAMGVHVLNKWSSAYTRGVAGLRIERFHGKEIGGRHASVPRPPANRGC